MYVYALFYAFVNFPSFDLPELACEAMFSLYNVFHYWRMIKLK